MFRVAIVPNSPDDPVRFVEGLATREEAEAVARRVHRESVREFLAPGRSREQVRSLWAIYGECATAQEVGAPPGAHRSCPHDDFDAVFDSLAAG